MLHVGSQLLQKELYQRIQNDPAILAFLQDGSLDGFIYWDIEDKSQEWVSPRFWMLLGYDPEEMTKDGSSWQDHVFADDLLKCIGLVQVHMNESGYIYDQEVRYHHKNGSVIWVRCRGLMLQNKVGKPTRMLAVHNDITQLKEIQKRLEIEQQRLNYILDGTRLGTWEWNVQTGEARFNEHWANIIGYKLAELEPVSITTWEKLAHPYDLERSAIMLEKHFQGEVPYYEADVRMMHKDGHWVWVKDRGMLVSRTENGDPLWMAGSHIDITRQKELEVRLIEHKRLLDKSNEVARIGTWKIELQTMKLYWSNVTREIHEVPDEYRPDLETAIAFYVDGTDRETLSVSFNKAVTEGLAYDHELRVLTAKGNQKWIRTVGVPEFENGRCVRVYGVFQDLTQRKETGLRNEHLLAVATNQNKRLLNFAHIVSHNLRSHSANFKMLLDLLDMGNDELNQAQILSHLRHASDALNETVGHLNEVVSMSHEVVENMRPLPLKKAIENASNHFLGLLRKAEVTWEVPNNLKVKAVPAYLDSIFTNLFSNSIRYSSPDRLLHINIKADKVDDKIIVLFTDNGLGIDLVKHGTKIFGMYKTFHKHPDSKGIGLFIVKNQIEAMNGIITVESKVDQYTTFKLTLDAPN